MRTANREAWRRRLALANATHIRKLELALRREFERLRNIDELKRDPRGAVKRHESRLVLIIGRHMLATSSTFGFLALEMLRPPETKADTPEQPNRADQVARVLLELAKAAESGARVAAVAAILGRDRPLVAQIELELLTAPAETPTLIARRLLELPRIRASVTRAQAIVAGTAELAANVADAATAPENATAGPPGEPPSRSPPPGEPPATPPGGGGGGRRRRSRFGDLVERIVREDAPVRARRIAATSGQVIARTLGEAAANGWGEEKLARVLEQRLGGQASRSAARRIARTEIGSAQNAATLAIARDREAQGERLIKTWAAIDDHRTRPTHTDADGQARPIGDPFNVGDALLMHPGDPSAPLKEIVNCRCAMLLAASPSQRTLNQVGDF